LQELNLSSIPQQLSMTGVADMPEGDERSILEHVSLEPLHIDEIRGLSQLPIALVSSTLAMMELKGLVRQVGGMHYVRA
jgi:DNA processing protein